MYKLWEKVYNWNGDWIGMKSTETMSLEEACDKYPQVYVPLQEDDAR